jgi:predicted RNase H-like HicB family nuclease
MIGEAIAFHLDGMRASGETPPPPSSRADYVDVEDRAA